MSWRYFDEDELKCKHCGKIEMDEIFMTMLNKAREIAAIPFIINSGYRCPEYDTQLEGGMNHSKGVAVDIKAEDSRTRFRIVAALIRAGFNRIGIAKTFVHVDMNSEHESVVMWLYN